MKILMANKFFYRRGGSETYMFTVGDELRAQGHEVEYFSMRHPENPPYDKSGYFVENVDFHAAASPLRKLGNALSIFYSFEARKKFERMLRDLRPDIVHVNNIHKQLTLSILDACKKHNIPVAATVHDYSYVCPNYQKLDHERVCDKCLNGSPWNCFRSGCVQGSKAKSLLSTLETLFYRVTGRYNLVDLFICPSDFMAGQMRAARYIKSGVTMLRNCLEDTDPPRQPSAEPPYFVYIGRLSNEKGVGTLIRAYASASADAAAPATARLMIVGDGPYRGEYEALAERLGVAGNIRFTGYLSGEALSRAVGESLAVVIPSEWYENCPYSVMEALAAGKPVIGARIGGIPEMVTEGETGFLFESGNAESLALALAKAAGLDQAAYNAASGNARAYARGNFSARDYAKKLLEEYNRLIREKGAPGW